jgi:dTDP-4-dehydrorhamnose reductase
LKIWILGREGLVGREIVSQCTQKGMEFVATSHLEADITDFKRLLEWSERERVTHIVNCAAYTDVDRAESEPESAYRVNAEGPENLAKVARERGIHLMHLSTDYVFDGRKKEPYEESDTCCPVGVYGHSKWLGEQKVLDHYPCATILRSSWIFGKGGKTFISSLPSHFRRVEELQVIVDQVSCLTYCKDLVETILSLIGCSGIFHFANRGEVSRLEIAQEFLKEFQERGGEPLCRRLIPILSSALSAAAKRPSYSALSTTKIEQFLGRSPRPWREVVKEYVNDAF